MKHTISRRTALLGVSSTALLSGCSSLKAPADARASAMFAHGVASGDPDSSSVVLWTRISGSADSVDVDWQVSPNSDFSRIERRGRVTTDASRDHTVKVVADGLRSGQRYYYRFSVGPLQSEIGRTLTLPAGRVDELTLAVASCSNYQFGFFNVYEAIADDDDVDIVVHLGDYLYEYDIQTYGGPIGQRIGRAHEPAHEMVSLRDYRQRHAQYKTDQGSKAMLARHPLVATWDDHESTNNPWSGGAQNHQPDEGLWSKRRADSLQAYYEWMPVRDPDSADARAKLWRHYKFGDLLSLVTLESRHTARSEQINVGDYDERLTDPDAARVFYDEIVGDPSRRMLSEELEEFLAAELRESVDARRPWRVIANQTILANVVAPPLKGDPVFSQARQQLGEWPLRLLDMLTNFGELRLAGNMDAWDGYPAARERFYAVAEAAGANDLLVITGDTHIFWQNHLTNSQGRRFGVELGTSAVTSPRGFYEFGEAASNRFDELTAANNDSVEWVDGRSRGYIRLRLNRRRAIADFITVNNIESRNYAVDTVRSVSIVPQDGTLRYG